MILSGFFNWVFPTKCLVCNREVGEGSLFCSSCFTKIVTIDYPFCDVCGRMLESSFDNVCGACCAYSPSFDKARSLFLYEYPSKRIIMKIKKDADSFAAEHCTRLLFLRYQDIIRKSDFIVPVPSHWSRLLRRGFNPADVIAYALSKVSSKPVRKILKRIKRTSYQKDKGTRERIENVQGAFRCREDLPGKSIVLVDDVMTTGATLSECARALKSMGCREVICITIASTKAAL